VTVAPHSLLVLGGARSGKSRHALEQARLAGTSVAFLATARALDGDMATRIGRHRAERPARWTTIEEPYEVPAASRRAARSHDLVVVGADRHDRDRSDAIDLDDAPVGRLASAAGIEARPVARQRIGARRDHAGVGREEIAVVEVEALGRHGAPSYTACDLLRLLLRFPRCSRPGVPWGTREGGANPPRPRHCVRGRNPQEPLAEGLGRRGE